MDWIFALIITLFMGLLFYAGYQIKYNHRIHWISGVPKQAKLSSEQKKKMSQHFGNGMIVVSGVIILMTWINYFAQWLSVKNFIFLFMLIVGLGLIITASSFRFLK